MSLEKMYYKLKKEDFDAYYKSLRLSENVIVFKKGDGKEFFYSKTVEISDALHDLELECLAFDALASKLSKFAKKQLIISFLVDEVLSTNKIEDINSTRHDVFYTLNNLEKSKDKKVKSIAKAYLLLLEEGNQTYASLQDIRDAYDRLMDGCLSKDDKPDGTFFRKGQVTVTDGVKIIDNGINGEENINEAMQFFLDLYNSDMNELEKMILCHFVIETIHPYYDGNGRFGRFLFSNGIYSKENNLLAFLTAKSFANQKSKYYKAFDAPKKPHEFGCINEFVLKIISILKDGVSKAAKELKEKFELLEIIKTDESFSKAERLAFQLIFESSILSNYGISNQEIINETGISERALFYALGRFKKSGVLEENKVGKATFHKIKTSHIHFGE
ncbi:MAG: Fic family protein [Bacilli bacterium]|nr:Fic family protein [Bacilli bacterium]